MKLTFAQAERSTANLDKPSASGPTPIQREGPGRRVVRTLKPVISAEGSAPYAIELPQGEGGQGHRWLSNAHVAFDARSKIHQRNSCKLKCAARAPPRAGQICTR